MNEAIRQIVERIWVNHIGIPPEWSQEQAETYFETEAARLAGIIEGLQVETQHSVIREWRSAHQGAEPDYMTTVGLINSAMAQAQEIVLSQELYEQIPEDEETSEEAAAQEAWEAQVLEEQGWCRLPEGDEPWAVQARANPERWKGVYRSDPTEETEEAVEVVWPDKSAAFQVWMGLLWQSRIEDGKAVPATEEIAKTQLRARRSSKDAAAEMEKMVDEELQLRGRPAR
jgi:hypothetical protein